MASARFRQLINRDPAAVRCPHAAFDELRSESPVHWSDQLQAFVVTKHSTILDILRAPARFSSAYASGPGSPTLRARKLLDDPAVPPKLKQQLERRLDINATPVLLISDPPLHIRQRSLVALGFTPRRVATLESHVRTIAENLVNGFGDGEIDFVRQFAQPLPMEVIAGLLGVPVSHMERFKRWSHAFTAGVGSTELPLEELTQLFGEMDEFYDYFSAELDERRVSPRDDLLSDLVAARVAGEEPLTQNEMLQMLVQFLIGGNETTANLLASLTLMLARDEQLQSKVRTDLSLLPALAEEALRLETPVQGMWRVATEDEELEGVTIPKDSILWLVYAAGNRDGEAYDDPHTVCLDDAQQSRPRHLAFGMGEHFCIGASLARMEIRVGMEVVLNRTEHLALAEPSDDIEYVPSFVLHGPRALHLRTRGRLS